ncbi:hypothetical protein C2S51_013109 [Perilla frutescens var. frutescens]|nr:hypothetical protein C2S51_013109 [Perilla frutescens var. frutescens]
MLLFAELLPMWHSLDLGPHFKHASHRCSALYKDQASQPLDLYSNNSWNRNVHISDHPLAVSPCGRKMAENVMFVPPPPAVHAGAEGGGLVRGVVTYMVMDNLVVKPMSASYRKHRSAQQAVKLLMTSLERKNVLTDDVFCENC